MLREEDYLRYKELLERNSSKDDNISLNSGKYSLRFHRNRIDEYLKSQDKKDDPKHDLLEQDFKVSLTEALKIMDAHGWV